MLTFAVGSVVAVALIFDHSPIERQQFTYLASSFLHGQLSFEIVPRTMNNIVQYQGKLYWALGPFPAILLMPFVAVAQRLGFFFFQEYLNTALLLGILTTWYFIAKKRLFSTLDAGFLSFAFVGASTVLCVVWIATSWYFSQTVVVFLLSLALLDYVYGPRWGRIGLWMALATATRVTVAPGLLFFVFMAWLSTNRSFERAQKLFSLFLPLFATAILLALYNVARFHSLSETGYDLQDLGPGLLMARSYGLFSLVHLPGNLYYFLLAVPWPAFRDHVSHVLAFPFLIPDPWGMSIFITSPYLLLLFFGSSRTNEQRGLWVAIIITAIPILLYYGIGFTQFGYRYALDFFPFLFFLFLIHLEQAGRVVSTKLKTLFVLSYLFNAVMVIELRIASVWIINHTSR